jgi:hypothetical protein
MLYPRDGHLWSDVSQTLSIQSSVPASILEGVRETEEVALQYNLHILQIVVLLCVYLVSLSHKMRN